jgi:hypothetical protein
MLQPRAGRVNADYLRRGHNVVCDLRLLDSVHRLWRDLKNHEIVTMDTNSRRSR